MDMRQFAKRVILEEGGKKSLSIAQVEKVLIITRNIIFKDIGLNLYNLMKIVKVKK